MSIKYTKHQYYSFQHKIKKLNPVIVFLAIIFQFSPVQASIVFDTFDVGGGFHTQDNTVAAAAVYSPRFGLSAVRLAAQFRITGGDFNFSSITFPISFQGNGPDSALRVSLAENNAGLPGAVIEILSENQTIWPAFENPFTTTSTLTSSTTPTLFNGSSYWIITELTSSVSQSEFLDYRWFQNTSGATVSILLQQVDGSLPSDPWTGYSGPNNLAFRIEASPIPLPGAAWLFGSGILGFLVWRKQK